MSLHGRVVVIYTDHTGLASPVLAARFLPNRGFTKPTRVGTGWSQNWSVAMGPRGRAVTSWLETTVDSTGSSITRQSQRLRVMSAEGRWGRTRVLARGDGAAGNSVAWVHGEIGVAWDSQSGAGIRVETKTVHQPWQRSTIARGATGGNLRTLDINAAGDLAITWENWKQGRGYSLALALRPAEGNWSAPRLVYTDLQISATGSVLVQDRASALVAYGDDVRRQAVARRAYLPAGS